MVELEECHVRDVMSRLQPNQQWGMIYADMEKDAHQLIDAGPSFALVDEDNYCIGCAGVWAQEAHRGLAWALLSEDMGMAFRSFHRAVQAFLDTTRLSRVEMAVRTDNKTDKKWAEMLGFKLEGLMQAYFPDGSDGFLYARVK